MPTVDLADVRRRFGGTVALDGVSLQAARGVTGLLGPNGAGKTTLLRMLATVLAPDAGERAPARPRPAARRRARSRSAAALGYLPQEPGFHRDFTAFEFVDYVAILKELTRPRGPGTTRCGGCSRAVDLQDVANRRIRALSGGMRRRVALAQALLGDPDLLVLDEPTAGLDPEQRLRFRELVSRRGRAPHGRALDAPDRGRRRALRARRRAATAAPCAFAGTPGELADLARGRVWLGDERPAGATVAWRIGDGRYRVVGGEPSGAEPVGAVARGRLHAARGCGHARRGGGVSAVTEVAPAPTRDRACGGQAWCASLAGVEARRLLLHPLVLIGLAMSALLTWQVVDEDSRALRGADGRRRPAPGDRRRCSPPTRPRCARGATMPRSSSTRSRRRAPRRTAGAARRRSARRRSPRSRSSLVQATVLGAWNGLEVTYQGQVETPTVLHLVQGPLLVGLFGGARRRAGAARADARRRPAGGRAGAARDHPARRLGVERRPGAGCSRPSTPPTSRASSSASRATAPIPSWCPARVAFENGHAGAGTRSTSSR